MITKLFLLLMDIAADPAWPIAGQACPIYNGLAAMDIKPPL